MFEKGQAQEATRLRDLKMDELEDHCYDCLGRGTIIIRNVRNTSSQLAYPICKHIGKPAQDKRTSKGLSKSLQIAIPGSP